MFLICNIKEQKCLQYQTIFLVKTNFNICLSSDLYENVITEKVASHGAYQKGKKCNVMNITLIILVIQ